MTARPRWTTLNLAALVAALAVVRTPRVADLAGAVAARDRPLHRVLARGPLVESQDESVLESLVVLERTVGTGWSAIGDALGTSAQAAEMRFAAAERSFVLSALFPTRRRAAVEPRQRGVAVPRDAEAWSRTLDGLAFGNGARPSTALTLDDATWLAAEYRALEQMGELVARGELPAGVDLLVARQDLEGRRLGALTCELAQEHGGVASPARVA